MIGYLCFNIRKEASNSWVTKPDLGMRLIARFQSLSHTHTFIDLEGSTEALPGWHQAGQGTQSVDLPSVKRYLRSGYRKQRLWNSYVRLDLESGQTM